MAQMVKNPPAMQEIQVRSLGQEYPLENGMATHSTIVAWKAPWTDMPGGLKHMGVTKSQGLDDWGIKYTHTHTYTHEWFCASFHILFICLSLLRQPLRCFAQFESVLIDFLAFTCKRFFEYNTCKSSLSTNPLEYMWF